VLSMPEAAAWSHSSQALVDVYQLQPAAQLLHNIQAASFDQCVPLLASLPACLPAC
jgi:hypothetical protein